MKLTVINLFHLAEDGFDAGPLEEFCRTHEVKGWVQHFFMDGGCPRLALALAERAVFATGAAGANTTADRRPAA